MADLPAFAFIATICPDDTVRSILLPPKPRREAEETAKRGWIIFAKPNLAAYVDSSSVMEAIDDKNIVGCYVLDLWNI